MENIDPSYKRLVTILARKFSTNELSEQDLFQEGMIALLKAKQTYKEGSGAKFETYASRCIQNRLIDVVRHERVKRPESESVDAADATGQRLEDEIDLIEKNDTIRRILRNECSDIERAIFNSYIEGFSYEEMSKIFELPRKKIDNTIQKIRVKIKAAI